MKAPSRTTASSHCSARPSCSYPRRATILPLMLGVHIISFSTRYGLYESLIMPFRLTNAPADLERFIIDVLHPFLNNFCTDYLDDILIYSDTLQEHRIHVKTVLIALSKAG